MLGNGRKRLGNTRSLTRSLGNGHRVALHAIMIKPGSILMNRDAVRPEYFQPEGDPCPGSWISVAHNQTPRLLEANLEAGGWTFFYMAKAITGRAFGFTPAKVLEAALGRLITKAKQQHCNALQIDSVATRTFLGIPFVDVDAHPRQIQKGMTFNG